MVNEQWTGERTIKFQTESAARIAWIDRLGEGMIPDRDTVMQEGDILHVVMREENNQKVFDVFEKGPEDD